MRPLTGYSSASPSHGRLSRATFALALVAFFALLGGVASAEDLQERLDRKEGTLGKVREKQGVLTSEMEQMSAEISHLEGEVASLRSQEAAVEAELVAKQAELDRATAELERAENHLGVVRERLRRALVVLRERLVSIYEAGSPDLLASMLEAEGWSDVVAQTEYLSRIQEQDDAIVERVTDLRNQAQAAVERGRALRDEIELARDTIAAQEAELQSTRVSLEGQQQALVSARGARRDALSGLEDREEVLEGDVSSMQAEIQAQLGGIGALYIGPAPSGSGAFIWPVSGTLTSGFGYRWGRQHEGIDVGAAEGTPIWAAADGAVALIQDEYSSGGYGNYTCLDHGGGISTCYAHQTSFAVSPGQVVSQGEVIGYVGNTGNSFGAHLHFEVRINGVAQDPLAYL